MLSKSRILNLLSALLILLFVYTAVSKLLDHAFFVSTLTKSPVVGWAAAVISYVLPITEMGVAALLVAHQRTRLGWYAAFALMATFTGYVGLMLLTQSKLPCSCGGALKGLTWTEHLFFNAAFTLLAFAGLWLSRPRSIQNIQLRFKTMV